MKNWGSTSFRRLGRGDLVDEPRRSVVAEYLETVSEVVRVANGRGGRFFSIQRPRGSDWKGFAQEFSRAQITARLPNKGGIAIRVYSAGSG